MIPNNFLTPLPFYTSIEQQNARKWWIYNRVYPLYVQAGFLPRFQLMVPYNATPLLEQGRLYDANTNQVLDYNVIDKIRDTGYYTKFFPTQGYNIHLYTAMVPAYQSMENGRYYLSFVADGVIYYSEVFTIVNDIEPYLKLQWWDNEDFFMDAGVISYANSYKNLLYLPSDLAKPEYPFEEEGENRDGYFFPIKMISEKRYRFNFLASEYLLDAMRFIRMSDFVEIEYHGQKYSVDSFLISPEWESNGDVAVVQAEFDTATVAKKIGMGYIKAQRGDFNDDFGNDFDNQ